REVIGDRERMIDEAGIVIIGDPHDVVICGESGNAGSYAVSDICCIVNSSESSISATSVNVISAGGSESEVIPTGRIYITTSEQCSGRRESDRAVVVWV